MPDRTAGFRRRQVIGGTVAAASLPVLGARPLADQPFAGEPADPGELPYRGRFLGALMPGSWVSNYRYTGQVAQAFRCERSGRVVKVKWYQIWSDEKSGYSKGDGGEVSVRLATWDPLTCTPGEVLGETPVVGPAVRLGKAEAELAFTDPVPVEAAESYAAIWTQHDPSRGLVSIDCPISFCPPPGDLYTPDPYRQPPHWGVYAPGSPSWRLRLGELPTFELHYEDGRAKGDGWLIGRRKDGRTIAGGTLVRQRLRTVVPATTSGFVLWLPRRSDAGGDLTVTLKDGEGRALARSDVPAARFAVAPGGGDKGDRAAGIRIGWVDEAWPRPVRLSGGSLYHLELAAPEDADYWAIPQHNGKGSFGYRADALGPRGPGGTYAQFSEDGGANWFGWRMYGVGGDEPARRHDCDLPVALRLTTA